MIVGIVALFLGASVVHAEDIEKIGVDDKLIFYTDGVYEYQNADGAFYGTERFHEQLTAFKDQPVGGLIDASFESLMAFGNTATPKDDISLMGIQLKSLGNSS